jgi:hypothetical protein
MGSTRSGSVQYATAAARILAFSLGIPLALVLFVYWANKVTVLLLSGALVTLCSYSAAMLLLLFTAIAYAVRKLDIH